MRFKLLILPVFLSINLCIAQTAEVSLSTNQGTLATPAPLPSSTAVASGGESSLATVPGSSQTLIVDYKSVFETATVEEEVKMAAERFRLNASQQDIWLQAATDRRAVEKQVREKLSVKDDNLQRESVYRGLKSAHTTFNETIVGYLSPAQKQALETDRLIVEEKRQRLAKLPPPPPPTPTVAPVDSSAIIAAEKAKKPAKKSKKKKKTAAQ